MLITKYIVWMIGIAVCVAALFTFYWPSYQVKLMKLLRIKPSDSVKDMQKLRKIAVLKLAIGIALIALSVALS